MNTVFFSLHIRVDPSPRVSKFAPRSDVARISFDECEFVFRQFSLSFRDRLTPAGDQSARRPNRNSADAYAHSRTVFYTTQERVKSGGRPWQISNIGSDRNGLIVRRREGDEHQNLRLIRTRLNLAAFFDRIALSNSHSAFRTKTVCTRVITAVGFLERKPRHTGVSGPQLGLQSLGPPRAMRTLQTRVPYVLRSS